jgi:hypothetical protein
LTERHLHGILKVVIQVVGIPLPLFHFFYWVKGERKMKRSFRNLIASTSATALVLGASAAPVLAANDITEVKNLTDWLTGFFESIQGAITGILSALAVVALLVMLGLWMATTDDKKTQAYKKKFFTILFIVAAIAAISGIVAIATAIGAAANASITGGV